MTAVTPLLWVSTCHFEHVEVSSSAAALDALAQGLTVVVPDFDLARAVLESLGTPRQTIDYRIATAQQRQADDHPD